MSNPRVSVVIPCYNQATFLHDSVYSILGQTFDNYEIIVVNDGSSQPSDQKLLHEFSAPKTIVHHQNNKGRSGARNAGIELARGKYILCLDADDKYAPTFLEKAVPVLDSHADIGLVTCRGEFFGAKSGEFMLADCASMENILYKHVILSTSALFRKEDWRLAGGFDPDVPIIAEDFDFWLSIVSLGRKIYRIPEILFYYRRHEDSAVAMQTSEGAKEAHEAVIRSKIYSVKKHINLYLESPDLLIKRLFPVPSHRMPRFCMVKKMKYVFLCGLCKALALIPGMSGIVGEKINKFQKKLAKIEYYKQLRQLSSEK